jgi:hypothetical protein
MQYTLSEPFHTTTGGSRLSVGAASISVFRHAKDPTPQTTQTVAAALEAIRTGVYALPVTNLRAMWRSVAQGEVTPDAYRRAKERLPALTFAGLFVPTRRKVHLTQHSGLIHGDLDHVQEVAQVKAAYAADPHVAYCFVSPSGDGLKVGVAIAPVTSDEGYQYAWQVVAACYSARYGVPWDPSGKDSCRLCFVSHDPQLYTNPCPEMFPVPPLSPPGPPVVWTAPGGPQTSAPSLARRYAEHLLAVAVHWITVSQPGGRHRARCKAAYLVGGVIGPVLTFEEAYATLEAAVLANTTTPVESLKTIQQCLAAGTGKPFAAPQVDQTEALITGIDDDGLLPPAVLDVAETAQFGSGHLRSPVTYAEAAILGAHDDGTLPEELLAQGERHTTGPPAPRRAVPRFHARLSGRLSARLTPRRTA